MNNSPKPKLKDFLNDEEKQELQLLRVRMDHPRDVRDSEEIKERMDQLQQIARQNYRKHRAKQRRDSIHQKRAKTVSFTRAHQKPPLKDYTSDKPRRHYQSIEEPSASTSSNQYQNK
ncbi:hypothetical protein ATL39_2354 [Sinobaca qinghaiensis]|uniref:Uncharacterized protein n=1 Tax=Sinobaca qinghaiensis TaxID=342944 RepID=A0A419V3S3_9BACL|nr:hypothetical protein [Sinobaca qinghaiensis]RKD73148.1 hypothetical protein ATL39_2354 [Sinobaca qinghaiensis]